MASSGRCCSRGHEPDQGDALGMQQSLCCCSRKGSELDLFWRRYLRDGGKTVAAGVVRRTMGLDRPSFAYCSAVRWVSG